jgi:hypothetical protein
MEAPFSLLARRLVVGHALFRDELREQLLGVRGEEIFGRETSKKPVA